MMLSLLPSHLLVDEQDAAARRRGANCFGSLAGVAAPRLRVHAAQRKIACQGPVRGNADRIVRMTLAALMTFIANGMWVDG
jgi:hypothetical protein